MGINHGLLVPYVQPKVLSSKASRAASATAVPGAATPRSCSSCLGGSVGRMGDGETDAAGGKNGGKNGKHGEIMDKLWIDAEKYG